MAILVLSLGVTYFTGDLLSSSSGTNKAQARMVATQLATKTVQEVENLGYSDLSEGISCWPAGTALSQCDPNKAIQQQGSCYWYGNPSNGLLVPQADSPSSSAAPLIPFSSSGSSGAFPSPTENGVTYTVAVYPLINTKDPQYPSLSDWCSAELAGTAPLVPVTLFVEVSWGANNAQHVSMQTSLYTPPYPVATQGVCQTPAVQQGAHDESLLASPNPSGSVSPGATVSIFFLDEAPTPNLPAFCFVDAGGGEEAATNISYTETTYGLSGQSTNPYLPASDIVAVNPYGGSGPNAANPPPGGTWCSGSNCNLEVQFTFTLPSYTPTGQGYSSITIADWDHEGDLDTYTWQVT